MTTMPKGPVLAADGRAIHAWPSPLAGLGPHGEVATSAEDLAVPDPLAEAARDASFSVGIVMHTTESDWAAQQLAGISATLAFYGAQIVSVADCHYRADGQVAAWMLSEHVARDGVVGIVAFGVDYYATNEREIGFRKWMRENRPDVALRRVQFTELSAAGGVVLDFLDLNRDVTALFVAWDEPGMRIARALRSTGRLMPMTSMDLGNEIAQEIARGDIVKGVGAQLPYDLGCAEAHATILALTGGEVPQWIALPAFAVNRRNILSAYQAVWHRPAPEGVRSLLRLPR